MNTRIQIINKISPPYIADDCVQIMLPYKEALTILSPKGILYHAEPESIMPVNEYLNDERRQQFPYSNIPIHFSKVGFNKVLYTNQILDFNTPYFKIGDGYYSELFVIKDNNQAFLVECINQPQHQVKHMTYDDLLKYFDKNNAEEYVNYFYLSGEILPNYSQLLSLEEDIYAHITHIFANYISELSQDYETTNLPMFLQYANNNLGHIDFSSMDFNIKIRPILIVRINQGTITLQCVEPMFVRENDYEVHIYDIPVFRYSLDQFEPKTILPMGEPIIPLRLNTGVIRGQIREARDLSRRRSRQKK